MLAAGSVSAYSVVGVLTDTTNWVFYWMSDLKTMRYTKRSTTFDGLNVLRCIIENLPDLNDAIYDPNGFGGKQPEFMEYPQRVYKVILCFDSFTCTFNICSFLFPLITRMYLVS